MKFLSKYWKVLLSLLMLIIAGLLIWKVQIPQKLSYEMQKAMLTAQNDLLQMQMIENAQYANVDIDKVEQAKEVLNESRGKLYRKFDRALLEEDQLIYVVWLEENFGTEIEFQFGTPEVIAKLTDGSELGGVRMTVNFDAAYNDYKKMLEKLSTDPRFASIDSTVFETYTDRNGVRKAHGYLTILHYYLDAQDENLQYHEPGILEPPSGKNDLLN